MSEKHSLSGLLHAVAEIIDKTVNPSGRQVFELDYRKQWSQAGTAPDATAFKIAAVNKGIITVTTTPTVISLADSVDPFGSLGSNVPNVDPEGMLLKLMIMHNTTPADGTGQSVQYRMSVAAGVVGWIVTWADQAIKGSTDSLVLPPQGIQIFTWPQGTVAMNDGVDDEVELRTAASTATVKIIYAAG